MILKKCKNINCGKFFPGAIGEFTFFCPECATKPKPPLNFTYMQMVYNTIRATRNVTIDCFDIYDSDHPYHEGFERLCRNCGSRLLKKDGTYAPRQRFCKSCGGASFYEQYLWDFVRDSILHENRVKFKEIIIEFAATHLNKEWIEPHAYCCEQCGKVTSAVEVHHKKPVHTLTNEEINLIWDRINLIVLCSDCHHQQDHQLAKVVGPPKEDPLQRKLLEWIACKEKN